MISLGALPARETIDQQIDKASYYTCLGGVTRYGLAEAIKAILRGKLGHAFFPSPPELRMQCDKAMEWYEQQRERQHRQERYMQDRAENNRITQRSPEAIKRQQEAYVRFCAGYESEKNTADEAERAEIRERYGLTDEAVADLPDQPLPSNFKTLGAK